ncbi:ParA family protein [Pseudoroseicyclus aestuarii]|uniref:Chromosome partitioning protein ParA n=1 Tax=Pseudoroseicyclus aestuarii TaxID=1795041 RepID=A0A318ST06_9RHOB|nr:ParA family protein [Pseudoroseicyclus aestuarii]PYE84465.1 chromosome segregation ATPase [Pseudoroseicyclus aestuarii]
MPPETSRRLPRILAVVNQKGGVGKTTTAINLGASLAASGRRVHLVDLDPQGNASTGLGSEAMTRDHSTYDLLLGDAALSEASRPTQIENLWLVPSTSDLSSADIDLMTNERRTHLLRNVLRAESVASLGADYVLIDCPPSLNILTLNAMVAADALVVPLQAEFFALEGLSQLMLTLREVRQSANPALRIEGVVLTMYDRRNNLSQQVEADARGTLGEMVFQTVIPRNVRLSEAPSHALSVLEYDPQSSGARAYKALAGELMAREAREVAE